MLVNLNRIKHLKTSDEKSVTVKDIYLSTRRGKVDQFVCRHGIIPFANEVLISPTLIKCDESNQLEPDFLCSISKKRLAGFRRKSAISVVPDNMEEEYAKAQNSFNQVETMFGSYGSIYSSYTGQADTYDEESHKRSFIHSFKNLKEYFVESPDTIYGRLHDIVIDTSTWDIEFLVVNVSDYFRKDLRLVHYDAVRNVIWATESIFVDLNRLSPFELPEYPGAIYRDHSTEQDRVTKQAAGAEDFNNHKNKPLGG